MKKRIIALIVTFLIVFLLVGCEESGSYTDKQNTLEAGNRLQENQPTPTDIEFSLQRYNLIRRAYYLNGQEEKDSCSHHQYANQGIKPACLFPPYVSHNELCVLCCEKPVPVADGRQYRQKSDQDK